jgi:cyclopropane-fatty-acyl-phospholipid synthase
MSARDQEAATRPIAPGAAPSLAAPLLRRLVGRLELGELVVETPGGSRFVFDGDASGPEARLVLHRWRALRRMLLGWDIGLAEGYIEGDWSTPDLVALLRLACENAGLSTPRSPLGLPRLAPKIGHALNRNTRRGSRRNIAAHYDLGNSFYEHWLDAGMSYSSGIFSTADQSLEEAQGAKLDRVLDLLDLRGDETVLELGCGWGALAERLLGRGCSVTGVTLSFEQLAFARQRLLAHMTTGACDIRLQDYRDVRGTFDRIVSIEMLEAVGEAFWPTYFAGLRDRLVPGGIAVLQVITMAEDRFEDYRRSPDFIQKYIFPGGMLPTVRIVEGEAERAGLVMGSRELFGQSYARTLAAWRSRFHAAWPAIEALGYDERFRRMWDYYLAYCQAGFEAGAIDVGLYPMARPTA